MGEVVEIKKGPVSGSSGPDAMRQEQLESISRSIVEICAVTEELYLSVGRNVQEYSDKALQITNSATSVSEMISGDELGSSMEGMGTMVDQFEEIFSRVHAFSNSNLHTLSTVGQKVKTMEKELEGLAGTSRDLKMLALSTKIQSTKTGSEYTAFRQLGEDIAKMAVIISSKAGDLLAESTALSGIVSNVKTTLEDLREKQTYQAESVLKWTRTIIESMAELSARSKKEAGKIRLTAEKISHSVSEMITSVQYQDISKQSLEKVVQELESGKKLLDSDPSGSLDGPEAPPDSDREVRLTGMYLRQVARLEKTDLMVKDSLEWMIRSMEEIIADIGRMTAITGIVYKDSSRFLRDLETAMSSVTVFLKEVVQSNREMTDSMDSFGHTVEEMSEFIQDIEMMSSEVELISLNARIMAAQAGSEGAGMGVIADAVKETARQSDGLRTAVVGKLNQILGTTSDLKGEVKDATRCDEERLDQLVRELGVFIDALHTMQKRVLATLDTIERDSSALINAIRFSISDIRSHLNHDNRTDEAALQVRDLALECSGRINTSDLLEIASKSCKDIDPDSIGMQQRLELVEAFFNEQHPDTPVSDVMPGKESEDEVVFFDNDL